MKLSKLATLSLMSISLCSCINNRTMSEFDLRSISLDQDTYDCVILGGGIGGLTASVYISMAGYSPLIIQGEIPGGLITQSTRVENWPGETAISGQELAKKIREQALSHNVKMLQSKIIGVDFKKWPYIIELKSLEDETTFQIKALSCIITMGTTPNMLKVPGESGPDGYFGKGVSTCAICDGNLYKNKVVAVVGSGNSAATEALYLSKLAKEVYLLARRNVLHATFTLQEQLRATENIKILFETQITKINGNNQQVTSISTLNTKSNTSKDIDVDGVFLAIGSTPNSEIFKNQLKLDENGHVKLFSDQESSRKGIFAAGDITDSRFKQAITAAGDSAKAALQAIDFLRNIGYSPKPVEELTETRGTQSNLLKPTEQKKVIIVPPAIPEGITEIDNADQFKQILNKYPIVIADFYGTYCIPCQQMHPLFQKASADFSSQVKFVKINVERNGALMQTYSISSVPTFIIFKNGQLIKRFTGSRSYESLKQDIKSAI